MNLKHCFLLLIVLLAVALNCGVLPAQSIWNNPVYFDKEKDRRLLALDHYLEKSPDSPQSKKLFESLYGNHVDIVCMQANIVSDQQMAKQAKAFLASRPQDGFSIAIACYWAFVGDRTKDLPKRKRHFDRLRVAVSKKLEGCSDFQRVLAYDVLWELLANHVQINMGGERQTVKAFGNALLDWYINDVEHEENLNLCVRLLERIHQGSLSHSHRGKVLWTTFNKRRKQIDPWMRDILSGQMELRMTLGHSEEKYAKAEKFFRRAHELKPERPEAAAMMVRVASGQRRMDEADKWFDKAINADPSYLTAWQVGLEYLGKNNPKRKLKIADQALALAAKYKMRGGQLIYLRTLNSIAKSLVKSYDEGERREILEKASFACDDYLFYGYSQGEFDSEFTRSVNFTIAYQMELFKEANEILEKHQGEVKDSLAYRPIVGSATQIVNRLKAIAASDKKTILELEKTLLTGLMTEKDCEGFISEVNDLQKRAPATADFAQPMLQLAQQHLRFHKGEWVELMIDKNLSHWSQAPSREWRLNLLGRVRKETFEVSNQNTIVSVSEKKHGGYLMYRPAFPLPFQVDAEIKSTPHGPLKAYSSKLIYSDFKEVKPDDVVEYLLEEKRSIAVSDNPFEKQRWVGFSGSAVITKNRDPIVYTSEKAELSLRLCDGYAEMYQPGKETEHVSRSYTRHFGTEREGVWRARIGVGPDYSFAGRSEFGKLRIRKTDFSPPPKDLEGKVEYWKARADKEQRFDLFLLLAEMQIALGNFEAALEASSEARKLNPKSLFARVHQGNCYTQLGQYKAAKEAFEETFKIPNTGYQGFKNRWAADWHRARREARAGYAFLLSTCPDDSIRNGEKAAQQIALIDKKVWIQKLRIDHALAAVAAENGDFAEAEKYLREATKPREEYDGPQRFTLPSQYVEDQCRAMMKSIKAKKPYRLKEEPQGNKL